MNRLWGFRCYYTLLVNSLSSNMQNTLYIILVFLCCLAFKVEVQAQSSTIPYTFSHYTAEYADLTEPISVNQGFTWDDPAFSIPIGFTFQYFDRIIDTIYIDSWFSVVALAIDDDQEGTDPVLFAYGADIIDRGADSINWEGKPNSLSPISYQLEGEIGSRILKIEWKNAGFFGDLNTNKELNDYVNFQVWLYEVSNVVELHFGPQEISDPVLAFENIGGPYIGLLPEFNYWYDTVTEDGLWLEGDPAAPQTTERNTLVYLDGAIPNGMVYQFTPSIGTGVEEPINRLDPALQVQLYPNPAKDQLQIIMPQKEDVNPIQVELLSISGKILQSFELNNTHTILDIRNLQGGLYLLQLTNDSGQRSYERFIVE